MKRRRERGRFFKDLEGAPARMLSPKKVIKAYEFLIETDEKMLNFFCFYVPALDHGSAAVIKIENIVPKRRMISHTKKSLLWKKNFANPSNP